MCKKEYKDMEEVYNDPEKFKELLRIGDPDDDKYLTSYGQAKKKWYNWVKKHTKIILLLTTLPVITFTIIWLIMVGTIEEVIMFGIFHLIYLLAFSGDYTYGWENSKVIFAPFVLPFILNILYSAPCIIGIILMLLRAIIL